MKEKWEITRCSERGASIVIALILLLVCAMVSTVIITSASVNVERSAKEVKERQAYHSVSSAIQASREILLQKQINDLAVWVEGSGTKTFVDRDFEGENWNSNGRTWASWVSGAARDITNGAREVGPYTETIDAVDSTLPLPKVKLSITMDSLYAITIKASLDESEISGGSSADLSYAISTVIPLAGKAPGKDGSYALYWADGTPKLKEEEKPPTPKPNDPPPEAVFYQSDVWGDSSHRDNYFYKHWRGARFKDVKIAGLYPYVWHTSYDYTMCVQFNNRWFIPQVKIYSYPFYGWADCSVVIENWATLIDSNTNAPRNGNYRHVALRQYGYEPAEYAPNGTSWYVQWKEVYIN